MSAIQIRPALTYAAYAVETWNTGTLINDLATEWAIRLSHRTSPLRRHQRCGTGKFWLAFIDTPPAAGPQAHNTVQVADLVLFPPQLICVSIIRDGLSYFEVVTFSIYHSPPVSFLSAKVATLGMDCVEPCTFTLMTWS